MTNLTRNGILGLGAAALLASGTANAQPTAASLKCSASKLAAYGKYAASSIKCYSKATSKGLPVDVACLAKAVTKVTDGFTKAVAKGGCPAEGEPDGNLVNSVARLDGYVNLVNTALGVVGPNKCQSKKLGEASKLVSKLFGCESKAAKKNIAVDQVKCVDKALGKLPTAYGKLEAKVPNDCTTTGDATGQQNEAQDVVRTQTTYTPRFDGCGNNLVTGAETCDDGNTVHGDFCPSDCTVDDCVPTANVRTVTLVTSQPDLSAITVSLDYPEGKVSMPGSGDVSGSVVPIAGTHTTNDFNHILTHVQFDVFDFGTTSVADFSFVDCQGASVPAPGEFTCTVVDAGQEDGLGGFQAVAGATCSVTVAP